MKSKSILSTEQENTLVAQLQESIFDLKVENEMVQRFLKFTGYNLAKAEEMLRKTVKWRKENDISSYLFWTPPIPVAEDYKFHCIGEDNDGHSVIYMPIGGWHTKKIMEMGYKEESLQFRFYLLEKIMESIATTKKSKFVMIMDMDGLTYKKCMHYDTIHFLGIAFKDFEEHYPEKLRACYIINAPWAFTYMYNALKHIFSSKTLNKAKIFDADSCKWKPFLMNRIPTKNLQLVCQSSLLCHNPSSINNSDLDRLQD